MLNQGYGKIINTASMASLIGEWWELTVVLHNPYFNYYRCYLNQLNLYWEGVNHWHFVLEEMYYKIFIDIIFQHLSVLNVLEHLLLFIEKAESPSPSLVHGHHRRGAVPSMLFQANSLACGKLSPQNPHKPPKGFCANICPGTHGFYNILIANRCLHQRCWISSVIKSTNKPL